MASLRRRVRAAEEQARQRAATALKLTGDAERLRCATADCLERETRLIGEAAAVRARTCRQEQSWRDGRHVELIRRAEAYVADAEAHRRLEVEAREELEAAMRGRAAVEDEAPPPWGGGGRWISGAGREAPKAQRLLELSNSVERRRPRLRGGGGVSGRGAVPAFSAEASRQKRAAPGAGAVSQTGGREVGGGSGPSERGSAPRSGAGSHTHDGGLAEPRCVRAWLARSDEVLLKANPKGVGNMGPKSEAGRPNFGRNRSRKIWADVCDVRTI